MTERIAHDPEAAAVERLEVSLVFHQLKRAESIAMNQPLHARQHNAAHDRVRRALKAESKDPMPRTMPPDCLDCAFYERQPK